MELGRLQGRVLCCLYLILKWTCFLFFPDPVQCDFFCDDILLLYSCTIDVWLILKNVCHEECFPIAT